MKQNREVSFSARKRGKNELLLAKEEKGKGRFDCPIKIFLCRGMETKQEVRIFCEDFNPEVLHIGARYLMYVYVCVCPLLCTFSLCFVCSHMNLRAMPCTLSIAHPSTHHPFKSGRGGEYPVYVL